MDLLHCQKPGVYSKSRCASFLWCPFFKFAVIINREKTGSWRVRSLIIE
jgi:hypothetical protein